MPKQENPIKKYIQIETSTEMKAICNKQVWNDMDVRQVCGYIEFSDDYTLRQLSVLNILYKNIEEKLQELTHKGARELIHLTRIIHRSGETSTCTTKLIKIFTTKLAQASTLDSLSVSKLLSLGASDRFLDYQEFRAFLYSNKCGYLSPDQTKKLNEIELHWSPSISIVFSTLHTEQHPQKTQTKL